MNYQFINAYARLSKKQLFQLFWYMKMVIRRGDESFRYVKDFHVFESYINFYNQMVSGFSITDDFVRGLLQQELCDVDDADTKNVLLSLQVALHTQTADVWQFQECNIRYQVICYVEWYRYFSQLYESDCHYRAKPVIWDIMRKHDAYTIETIESGHVMELMIEEALQMYGFHMGLYFDPHHQNRGESSSGIEVKHDRKSRVTGNFYIEYAERHSYSESANYVPSGIMKQSNTNIWVIGVPEEFYFVREADLRNQLYMMNPDDTGWQDDKRFVASSTSFGYIIRRQKMRQIALADNVADFVRSYGQIAC